MEFSDNFLVRKSLIRRVVPSRVALADSKPGIEQNTPVFMENLAGLLTLLPKPKVLPEYDVRGALEKLRANNTTTLEIYNKQSTTTRRNETGALVQRAVSVKTDEKGIQAFEQTIAGVNQPADRLIQATPSDANESFIVPSFFPRPSPEEIALEIEETKNALESLINHKIAARQPSAHQFVKPAEVDVAKIVEYRSDQGRDRVIMIQQKAHDPMSPPRFKHKRAPAAPPSPPAPVLHSPPRKLTTDGYNAWKIPPCVSMWKNPRGYTVPLDKRLASDGRALMQHSVNDRFASLTESLYVAEEQAREELSLRADIEARRMEREQVEKETNLRTLLSNPVHPATSNRTAPKTQAHDQEGLFDPRLFDRTQGIASGLGADDEAYNLYDRPISSARSVLSTRTALVTGTTFMGEDGEDAGKEEGRAQTKGSRRDEEYAKLASKDYSQPLQFVRSAPSRDAGGDTEADPFGLDAFLAAAKSHYK